MKGLHGLLVLNSYGLEILAKKKIRVFGATYNQLLIKKVSPNQC